VPHPEDGGCLNCGATLVGPYCHRCGQEAVDRRRSLRALLSDALGDLFSFDSRILRTVVPLLFRPGYLTVEWVKGRRVDFVPPLRLYVFTAAIFFFVMAAAGAWQLNFSSSSSGEKLTVEEIARRANSASEQEPEEQDAVGAGSDERGAVHDFERRLTRAVGDDAERFKSEVIENLATFSLFLAPASALILALLYWRRYLVEHVVFTLHLHVFVYTVLAVRTLISGGAAGGEENPVVGAVLLTVVAAYSFLALRRVYGGRWWATVLRGAAFAVLYLLVVLLPTMLLSYFWTVYAVS
jgi:hypothetical protein